MPSGLSILEVPHTSYISVETLRQRASVMSENWNHRTPLNLLVSTVTTNVEEPKKQNSNEGWRPGRSAS